MTSRFPRINASGGNSFSLARVSACRGTALVFVLAIIVLIAGLVVAYLLTATRATQSAATYRNDVATQQLAETAVSVVIGQIADGTHSAKQGVPDKDLVWTSQPGLIRTYDTDGKPYRFYKLYSSDNMVVRQFDNDFWSPEGRVKTEVPDDWYERGGLFADLNEPSLLPLDPGVGATRANPEGAILINGIWYYANYPIVDPSAQPQVQPPDPSGRDGVEGFAIDATRLSSAPSGPPRAGYNPTLITNPRRSPNPAPMPVRWLYVLRDGRLSVPGRSLRTARGTEVSWPLGSLDAPTRNNPVVGRIAFWSDDETCKLNINTASEGTFWDRGIWPYGADVPPEESKLSTGIPRSNEWQRTPGHPAMTCLSPVFGMLLPFRVPLTVKLQAGDYRKFAPYYDLIPRVSKGGSEAGTSGANPLAAITLDSDRLFASVDELLYTPKLLHDSRENSKISEETNTGPLIARSFLQKAKFFLTTANRAPETNIFNRPRISLWPVQQETDPNSGKPGGPDRPRTDQDDRFALCATLNKKPYFFQRYSVYLSTTINDEFSHPGNPFGQQGNYAPPSSQRPDLDWKIQRNHELYRYLQDLTQRPLPGIAGKLTLADKLGRDRDQLLTSMVDLLRTANDLKPSGLERRYNYSPQPGTNQQGFNYRPMGLGQIVPLIPPVGTPGEGTKGIGRFPTIGEVAIVFYRLNKDNPAEDSPVEAMLAIQPFSPAVGEPPWAPLARICVQGLDNFAINGKSVGMPKLATNLYAPSKTCEHNAWFFACAAVTYTKYPHGDKTIGTLSEGTNYPFYSRTPVSLPKGASTFEFGGGTITMQIHAGYYGQPGSALTQPLDESLVQTLKFEFPPATLPVPELTRLDANLRLMKGIIIDKDVSRSIQLDPDGPTGGDFRLLAATSNVPAKFFRPHPDYFSSKPDAHSMRGYGVYIWGATDSVELQPGFPAAYGIAANGLHGAFTQSKSSLGDWDNAVGGGQGDGGQFIRPDEGSLGQPDGAIWSPMRQLPSPVVFGSLPVGVKSLQPWRTLLFCANPASGKFHPGWKQPRDHYLLDFFQMPVVEPYAISEPLSTAGKVNLNCQIVPFTYIRRETALRGALRGTKVTALLNGITRRLNIDADQTLKGFQQRFADKGGCFKTASELCEMYLIPEGATLLRMQDGNTDAWWWKPYLSTGDNSRESPYNNLYSRVTARSNTFTVHYRVQALGHNSTGHPNVWIEGSDPILSEARGSTMIERYVDPDDPRLRDFATDPSATLDDCYKFRVLQTRRFGR